MSIIHMVNKKNLHYAGCFVANVTSKLSQTKVNRCVTQLATKESVKSSIKIKFCFLTVYTVIF